MFISVPSLIILIGGLLLANVYSVYMLTKRLSFQDKLIKASDNYIERLKECSVADAECIEAFKAEAEAAEGLIDALKTSVKLEKEYSAKLVEFAYELQKELGCDVDEEEGNGSIDNHS